MVSSLLGTGAEEQEGNTLTRVTGVVRSLIVWFLVGYYFVENLIVLVL